MSLKQLKFFVIDECDKVLEKHGEFSRLYGCAHALLTLPCSCARGWLCASGLAGLCMTSSP
jgi:hypothetical protein